MKLRPSFFILFVGFFAAILITFLIVVFFHVLSMIISHPSFLDTPLSEFEGLLEDARGLYWSDPLGGIISVLTFVVGGFAVLILYLTKPVWRRMQVIDMAGYSVVISLLLFGAFLELPYALMSIWFNFPLKIDLVVLAIVFLAIVGLVRFFLGLRDRFKLAGFIAMVLIPLISLPGIAISSKITGHLPEAMRHIPLRAAAILDGVFTHIVLKEICESSPQRCDNTYLGVVRFEDNAIKANLGKHITRLAHWWDGFEIWEPRTGSVGIDGLFALRSGNKVIRLHIVETRVSTTRLRGNQMSKGWITKHLKRCRLKNCKDALDIYLNHPEKVKILLYEHDFSTGTTWKYDLDEKARIVSREKLNMLNHMTNGLESYCASHPYGYCDLKP